VNQRECTLKKYGDIFGQWNLRSTPFAVEALKCDAKGNRLLRGRDEDIEDVVRKLHRVGKITCIDGQFGIGKTSLVNVAIYRCLQAFKKNETAQLLIPCKVAFQLKEDLDIEEFVRTILCHVVMTIKEHEATLKPICDITGFNEFHKLIHQPIFKFESGDVSNSLSVGVPGIANFTTGGKGSTGESANNTQGFIQAGFESQVKALLERLFTSVSGGVVCVIDNVELLETAERARKTLELLRDRLLTTQGLRWVFCGANGVIHSLASSPRLAAFLNTPVLDLTNVRTIDLKDLIFARLEEYSPKPKETLDSLPFGMAQIEWMYEVLNFNLRDLLSHLEQYCEHVSRNKLQVERPLRDSVFRRWVQDFGQFNYRDISRRISKNSWLILDAAMSDDFKGTFNAGQYADFNRNSRVPVAEETFRKWLRDLRKHDILTQSIPDDNGDEKPEIELETYSVTSKGALIFYYRQKAEENLTLSAHSNWLKRVNF
jgi:hypothetical protein